MPSHKAQRNAEDIKRELTAILREMKDPRVRDSLISIVRVDVAKDLSFCKVYISAMEGIDAAKKAVAGLKSGEGFIKHELANRLSLRQIPSISFKPTDSIEYSANISKLINKLKDDEDDELK